jgi:uncharacterized protein YbjT (DUF2867 family)
VSRPAFPILVLGGYGVFGSRVVRLLARDPGLRVIIAGRDPDKARALAREIEGSEAPTTLETLAIDGLGADLAQRLAASGAKLVINAAGPFQGQDYRVPQACIAAGLHYLDLADSQDFVAGFSDLDRAAREAGVTAVTGASTVPALSSAVIDALKPGFARLDALDIAISPGNRAPRGRALVAAILKTAGKPLPRWQDGAWTTVRGWHDLGRRTIAAPGLGSLGPRWLSACDAPDTLLFPERYGGVRRVRFRAGVELGVLHLGLWALSWLPALGLIGSLEPLAGPCRAASTLLLPLGSDRGGMHGGRAQWLRPGRGGRSGAPLDPDRRGGRRAVGPGGARGDPGAPAGRRGSPSAGRHGLPGPHHPGGIPGRDRAPGDRHCGRGGRDCATMPLSSGRALRRATRRDPPHPRRGGPIVPQAGRLLRYEGGLEPVSYGETESDGYGQRSLIGTHFA